MAGHADLWGGSPGEGKTPPRLRTCWRPLGSELTLCNAAASAWGDSRSPREAAGSCTPLYPHAVGHGWSLGLWGCGGGTVLSPSCPGERAALLESRCSSTGSALPCSGSRGSSAPRLPRLRLVAGAVSGCRGGLVPTHSPRQGGLTGVQGGRGSPRQAAQAGCSRHWGFRGWLGSPRKERLCLSRAPREGGVGCGGALW